MSAECQAASAVELRGLTLSVGSGRVRRDLLREVDLAFEPGAVTCVVGPSGSGKSTLLRAICGMASIGDGDILVSGTGVRALSARKRLELRRTKVTMVHQDFNLVGTLTARENVRLALELAGVSSGIDDLCDEWLSRLGLEDLLDHFPATLSGGERQRVAIARSLATPHRIVLADEPTGALDQENAARVIKLFEHFSALGKCCIIVTHDRDVAAAADIVYTWRGERLDR